MPGVCSARQRTTISGGVHGVAHLKRRLRRGAAVVLGTLAWAASSRPPAFVAARGPRGAAKAVAPHATTPQRPSAGPGLARLRRVPARAGAEGGGRPQESEKTAAGATAVLGERGTPDVTQDAIVLGLGVVAAVLFGLYVLYSKGVTLGAEWFTCYFLEYALSIDNLFVFIVIFKYFKVPPLAQKAVLGYGIAGAAVLRFLFVYLGAEILQQFDFLILGFAGLLLFASYTGLTQSDDNEDDDDDLDNNFIVKNVRRVIDVSSDFDGDKFFIEQAGRSVATPLLLCLIVIEFSDIVFATDSVPAVLGTTQDPFVAYSSNLFAIFGLRALFTILEDAILSFSYLESAVNVVLGYIGLKIIVDYTGLIDIPVLYSLAIVLSILGGGVALSLMQGPAHDEEATES